MLFIWIQKTLLILFFSVYGDYFLCYQFCFSFLMVLFASVKGVFKIVYTYRVQHYAWIHVYIMEWLDHFIDIFITSHASAIFVCVMRKLKSTVLTVFNYIAYTSPELTHGRFSFAKFERQRDRELSSGGSLPRCLQCLELDQTEARSWPLNLGLLCGCQGHNYLCRPSSVACGHLTDIFIAGPNACTCRRILSKE